MARGLRIVGGSAGGRRLVAPKGDARPTTDRVKEALFNVLGARVVGAAVLDLYAGSGALGIEALSRGARARGVRRRRRGCRRRDPREPGGRGLRRRCAGHTCDGRAVRRAARARAVGAEHRFDLVLLDPPYDTPTADVEGVLTALAALGACSPRAAGSSSNGRGPRGHRRSLPRGRPNSSGHTAIRS